LLTSLLPGLRELRTPLAIGYVWLLNCWLAFADIIPRTRPPEGALKAIWDLGTALGATTVLAAISFTAYMIGSVLEINPQGPIGKEMANFFVFRRRFLLSPDSLRGLVRYLRGRELQVSEEEKELVSAARVTRYGLPPDTRPEDLIIINEVAQEIPQIATRLQVSNADLYTKYDRLLAEASLRMNIGFPITILISFVVAYSSTESWSRQGLLYLAVLIGYLISRQGFTRIIAARDVIVQALISIDELRSRRIDERTIRDSPEAPHAK